MKAKIIRFMIYFAIAFGVILMCFFCAALVKLRKVTSENPPVKSAGVVVAPPKQATLGQRVTFESFFDIPWNKKPFEAKIAPGQGSQVISGPEIKKIKTRWGHDIWSVSCALQPFFTGDIPAGKLSVSFVPEIPNGTNIMTVELPAFRSLEISNLKDELNVAAKLSIQEERKKTAWFYAIAAILIVVALAFFYFLWRGKNAEQKPLEPWEKALNNLSDLNSRFSRGGLGVAACVTTLTDIVRDYLEARFDMRAPRQTTAEFLKNMENSSSPLNNKDRNFLKDFMTSADMIKFAKYEAERELIQNSIDRASRLVEETAPVLLR